MTTTTAIWQGPCTAVEQPLVEDVPHASWDLDIGEAISWFRAVQVCIDCPVSKLCTQMRGEMFPTSNPAGVIWAGVAYSETGRVLDAGGLRRLDSTRRNRVTRGRPRRELAA